MSKIIVMIGAPGAGKGTQARLLSEKYGYPQISTGDILRSMAKADTPQARQLRETLAAGKLVSDDILAELIYARTAQDEKLDGYILDGFPRTLKQAYMLEDLAKRQSRKVMLFRIVVNEDVLFKRLTGRWVCTKCGEIYNIYFRPPKRDGLCDNDGAPLMQREDDTPEAVNRRFEEYWATATMINYYKQSGRLIEFDGERQVRDVFDEICGVIDKCNGKTGQEKH